MSIGNQIKFYRKKLHLSQEELAQKSGLSRNAIYNYENERRSPDIDTLKRIAETLGIKLSELIDGGVYIDISGANEVERQLYLYAIAPDKDFGEIVKLFESQGYCINELGIPGTYKIEIKKNNEIIASMDMHDFIQLGKGINIILDNLNNVSRTIIENLIKQYSTPPKK